MVNGDAERAWQVHWNGRKLWLKSQIDIMRINALVRTAAIPLPGVDFWHIFETQVLVTGCLDTSGSEQDRVYTYTADLAQETNIPVFSCYVNEISSETDTVEIMYVFLIDNDVLEIDTSDTYGIMEVMTASSDRIVLNNDETILYLDLGSTEYIGGNVCFKTADDDVNDNIRFYPMVEYTEPGTYEVRGDVVNLACVQTADLIWNSYNFAGLWYDLDDNLMTEELRLVAGTLDATTYDRTIDEDCLSYRTSSVYQQYKLYTNEGLTVDSDHPSGDTGYWIEGWIWGRYVAIDGKADKLTKPLVEFDRYDVKTLNSGDIWDIGAGFVLKLMGINDAGNMATLQLFKNGVPLKGSLKCIDTSTGIKQDRVYTYLKDVADEDNIPIFSCYVAAVFKEGSTSYVQLKYVFLIDDDVIEIETSDTYGAMEVMTASNSQIVLRNNEHSFDLDTDTTEHIIGDMYFKTADDPYAIRFYPFAERTIDGEEPTPPPDSIPAIDSDGDGVPNAWDDEPDTSDGYYTDSHGRGRRWGDMNGDGELTSVDALMILQAAVGGASAQSIAIKAGDGSDLPDSIGVGETFTVLITEDGSPVDAGTSVTFRLPYDTGDPVIVSTDDDGKARYMPPVTGTLGIRVLNGTGTTVANATVEVIEPGVSSRGDTNSG